METYVVGHPQGASVDRAKVEETLTTLEQRGSMLTAPAAWIWQGQRDLTAFTERLDATDSRIVERILELLNEQE